MNHWELRERNAVISECGRYRYALHRRLTERDQKSCLFIMLNPSTADGTSDDPTIRRCVGFARDWDCDRLYVANLFAWRATDPKELRKHGVGGGNIVGPHNQTWLEELADVVTHGYPEPGPIVCAWGPNGRYMRQDETVTGWLEEEFNLQCLGRAKDGSPRHPLMLAKATALQPFGYRP